MLHRFFAFEIDCLFVVYHRPRTDVAQDVGLAEDDVRDTVHADGALERLHVHPIGLAAAARRRTEFLADVADFVEELSFRLKLFASDVRFIYLRDTPDVAYRGRG